MKRFIDFGSIGQFRNVCHSIKHATTYVGKDEAGGSVFDRTRPLPQVQAIGSEKIHGTNAAVCYNATDGLWVQSRSKIITVDDDNAGSAFFVEQRKRNFIELILKVSSYHNIDLQKNTVALFFEFCGNGIQKNSAASGLDKCAVLFAHFKVSPEVDDSTNYWLPTSYSTAEGIHHLCDDAARIYNIQNYNEYGILIDFNNPTLSVNRMIQLVSEVESNSPFGEANGIKGNVGEGIVFTFMLGGQLYRWKVKGEKHSNSKVKKLAPVDDVLEQKKIDFANYATPAWRLEQMWQKVFGINNEICEPELKKIPDFLRALNDDVLKEESDKLVELGLEPKMVFGKISDIGRRWFIEELNKSPLL